MRILFTFMIIFFMWQIAYGTTQDVYATSLSGQERLIGFKTKKHTLSFSKSMTVSYLLSDSVFATDMYNKGKQDAKIYYRNRGAFWIPFGATIGSLIAAPVLLLPGVGTGLYFLPGISTGLYQGFTKPKAMNLRHHDIRYRNIALIETTDQLFQDSQYVEGYRKGAQQRKLGMAAGGVGAGLGVGFLLVITLAIAAMAGT